MYRCIYKWNSFRTHFVANDNSDVTIKESQFTNNNSTKLILDVGKNECFIRACLFEGNTGWNIMNVKSSNITTVNNVFLNSLQNGNGIMSMNSTVVELNNYLEIENCTFNESQIFLAYVY